MAKLDRRPYPPGTYPVVVVGSGPGGLQMSYSLRSLGIEHALISKDDSPGGMFRKFPLFDRLISWTKPYAPHEHGTREYEWYDWNSLLFDDPKHYTPVADFMDGTSEFPARHEMEAALVAFTKKAGIKVRFDCTWDSTRHEDGEFVLTTGDGEYRCKVAVFAIGMTEPWKPDDIAGIKLARHYMRIKPIKQYKGKHLYIIGKGASAFEIADGLLPWATQIVLASPRPARLSVLASTTAAVRARYMQPLEDHAFRGGTVSVLDAATERIEKRNSGFRVHVKGTTRQYELLLDVDEVIVATGVATPLVDLPKMGVQVFYRGGRLPAQTPYWGSPTVEGIYFAGSVTQGSFGLRKYSSSAAVHGFRYNARILAAYIAEKHFGIKPKPRKVTAKQVVPYLLAEATRGPELWNQQAYLGRVLTFDSTKGILDQGIHPLAHFVDDDGPDGVAVGVEFDAEGDPHPMVYLRRKGQTSEHILASNTLIDFESRDHRSQLEGILKPFLR